MKVFFIGSAGYVVYLMKFKFKPTQDPAIDTLRLEYLLGPCAVLALIFNYRFSPSELLWAFSIYLEAVGILPQLFMLQRTGEAETITTHYLNRAPSRPPLPGAGGGLGGASSNGGVGIPSRKSFRGAPVTLNELVDGEEDEWEPSSEDPEMSLDEVRESIEQWEEELKARGRPVSGRTIVVVHSLPYVCTLHPTTSHSTSYDDHVLPLPPHSPVLTSATVSGTTTPLEIAPGDPLLRPRALHSPTLARQLVQPAINSFKSPASSLSPSFHPACPPSRAPSPDINGNGGEEQQRLESHRWVLHPRRGHAALNSGLKSLSGRSLTVVGRPDDLMRATGGGLGQGELGEDAKRDLERGLKSMAGEKEEGLCACLVG
ncbi:ER lumen protein retaining receptor, partial [Phenoliferia sp. Uapishka_3]